MINLKSCRKSMNLFGHNIKWRVYYYDFVWKTPSDNGLTLKEIDGVFLKLLKNTYMVIMHDNKKSK